MYFQFCSGCYLLDIIRHMFRVFFFKRKTAYEMRISDWSSDVCSSVLAFGTGDHVVIQRLDLADFRLAVEGRLGAGDADRPVAEAWHDIGRPQIGGAVLVRRGWQAFAGDEIGRAHV